MSSVETNPHIAGFALIDVLVAITIFGTISMALMAGVSLVGEQQVRLRREMKIQEAALGVGRLVRLLAEGAIMPLDIGDQIILKGDGSSQDITLYSTGPEILGIGSPLPLTLKASENKNGYALDLVWIDPMTGSERRETILDDAAGITLSVLLSPETTVSRRPQTKSIRVAIQFKGSARPITITARLQNELPFRCATQPAHPTCRSLMQ